MLRYAAVRPDGSITRIITASDPASIDLNLPKGTTKVEAPDGILTGVHRYDFSNATFELIS